MGLPAMAGPHHHRLCAITPLMYWFKSRRSLIVQACGDTFTPFSRNVLGIKSPLGRSITDDTMYPIHEGHLPQDGLFVYRGISGEQFHGNNAS